MKLDAPPASRDIEVWPDNWQVMEVFISMMSQWNTGMSGVIGLRYEALPIVFSLCGIKRQDRRGIFEGLRVMERAAISELSKG